MTPNFPLPDWMPWWAQLAILVLAILFGFAFLMMPFAVFGIKGRLDFLEAQLDDIHAELRMVATRLLDPDRAPARGPVFEELPRPVSQRTPSPVQTPVAAAAPSPEPARPVDPRPDLARFRPDAGRDEDHPAALPLDRSRFEAARPEPSRPASDARLAGADAPRNSQRPPVPARFTAAREPAPLRYTPPAENRAPFRDEPTGDWDEEERPRPLRATTLRDPGRDSGRDPGRDRPRDGDPDRDRGRSEPTLRWPPR